LFGKGRFLSSTTLPYAFTFSGRRLLLLCPFLMLWTASSMALRISVAVARFAAICSALPQHPRTRSPSELFLQPAQRLPLDLPHSLARQAKLLANLAQRLGFLPTQAKPQPKHLLVPAVQPVHQTHRLAQLLRSPQLDIREFGAAICPFLQQC